jgi:hypothetical protein
MVDIKGVRPLAIKFEQKKSGFQIVANYQKLTQRLPRRGLTSIEFDINMINDPVSVEHA